MINKKLFYGPLITIVALSLAGFIAVNTLLTQWLTNHTIELLDRELNTLISELQTSTTDSQTQSINEIVAQQSKILHDRRLTLIEEDGTVTADSLTPTALLSRLDNYAERPEVIAAINNGEGYSFRFSESANWEALYLAKRFMINGKMKVYRIATPTMAFKSIIRQIESLFLILFIIIISLTALVTYFIQRRFQLLLNKENTQQEQRIQDRTREIELLHRFANMLTACNSITEAQQVVEDIIPRILGNLNGAVSMIRSSRNLLEIKLDWGGIWPGSHSYSPDECWALRKGKYHLANDNYTTLACSHMHTVGNDQTLCIPLIAHGNTIGLMHLYLRDQVFSNEKMQLAFTVAEHLGLALANLNLQDKLRQQAIRDPLTGLYNRRFLEESMQQEMMRAKRHSQPVSILALDIDHFKRFNDNFGHDAGDYVLKTLSSVLLSSIRGEDILFRTGGEELTLMLTNTSTEQALNVGNKLCAIVRDLHLVFHESTLGKITMSIGIATFPIHCDDADSLLKQADTALYYAKEKGRDQCIVAAATETYQTDDLLEKPPQTTDSTVD